MEKKLQSVLFLGIAAIAFYFLFKIGMKLIAFVVIAVGLYFAYKKLKDDDNGEKQMNSGRMKSRKLKSRTIPKKPNKNRKIYDEALYLYDPNCFHCKRMTPVIDEVNDSSSLRSIKKKKLTQELAQKYKIYAVPALILIRDNKIVDMYRGDRTKSSILEFIE